MNINLKQLHVWIPGMFEFKGGIQVYSSFLLQALQELYPQAKYHVFLKNDAQATNQAGYLSGTRFHCAGRWSSSLRTLAFAAQLMSQGLLHRPDLIITTHLNFAIAAQWLKRFTGIPYWVVAHGIEAWNIEHPAIQAALQNADRILCVSHYTRDRLLKEQNLDPNKLGILFNTFNVEQFTIAPKPPELLQRYNLHENQPVILTVSRLCHTEIYKGYDKVLEALPKIRQVIPNIHYLLVGKGDDRPRIESLVKSLELEDCVTLVGYVSDNELPAYYNLCNVFAMPSQKEGFGIVYLEALASGKPVLGGNQDGAIDALCHGTLGALVNPNDVEAIAQTLLQILQGEYSNSVVYKPELLRQKVIDMFGFEQFKQTLASYFDQGFG